MNITYHNRRKKFLSRLTKQLIKELKENVDVYNETIVYVYLNRAFSGSDKPRRDKRLGNSTAPIYVEQYNVHGSRVGHFNSLALAEKYTGIKSSQISDVINGKRLTAGGYYWIAK